MDVRNVLVGVIFVVILYVVYVYAFKKKQSTLVTTQKVDKAIPVNIQGNNSSNSYSQWIYISEWNVDQKKHIMTRFSKSFHNKENKCYSPTVYLEKNNNTLNIAYQYANNLNNLRTNCQKYIQIQKYALFKDYDSVKEYNTILKLIKTKII